MPDKVSLATIKAGAVIDEFDAVLEEVFKDCIDSDTTLKAREITLKVSLVPSKTRSHVGIQFNIVSKMGGKEPSEVLVEMATDERGRLAPREMGRAKQRPMFDHEKVAKLSSIRKEGE